MPLSDVPGTGEPVLKLSGSHGRATKRWSDYQDDECGRHLFLKGGLVWARAQSFKTVNAISEIGHWVDRGARSMLHFGTDVNGC